jgi:hypothetical protein
MGQNGIEKFSRFGDIAFILCTSCKQRIEASICDFGRLSKTAYGVCLDINFTNISKMHMSACIQNVCKSTAWILCRLIEAVESNITKTGSVSNETTALKVAGDIMNTELSQ